MADIMTYLTLQAPMLQSHLNGLHLPAHSMGAQVLSQAQASALQQQLANQQLANQQIANQQLANQHMGSLQQQVGHLAVFQLTSGHDGQRAFVIAVEADPALHVASSAHTLPTAVLMMLLQTDPAAHDTMTCK